MVHEMYANFIASDFRRSRHPAPLGHRTRLSFIEQLHLIKRKVMQCKLFLGTLSPRLVLYAKFSQSENKIALFRADSQYVSFHRDEYLYVT